MKTCKGPHTEGNTCLQTTHFSAAMGGCKRLSCKLMGSSSGMSCMGFLWIYPNSTYRFTWVVGKSAPTTFLPIGDPNNILTNIKWILQQQYSYQLVILILGCNSPKISCIPRHLHPKKISTNPRWTPMDETTCGWGQQNLSLWQAFKNTACHVLFTEHGKPPWSICKHLKIQSKNWETLVHVNMRLHCNFAWWRGCQFEYWSWSYIT